MAVTPSIENLRANLRGKLYHRGDEGYDEARKLYNGMIDKRPLLIVKCVDIADVVTSVRFGRQMNLLTAVRGGGHNGGGLGSCDDGLVIDLSLMNGIRVDPARRTVRAGPGCSQGDIDHATHAFGLAVPAGVISTTGIAGLTLGGGHGYLTRKHGLTIDNLLEADVVLADGRFVTASEQEHEDLFWALRGGGGNFGIVTSFFFRAHPVHMVYAGPIFWDIKESPHVLQWYRDFLPNAPEELSSFFSLNTVPSADPFPREIWGRKVCALISCYNGQKEKGEWAMQPIRKDLPPPILDAMGMMPFPALQSLFDPLLPPGLQWYWKADFVQELPDKAIDIHLKYGLKTPSALSLMHLYPIDGAVHRVDSNATAWSYRDVTWSMSICGIDPDSANADRITSWAKNYWRELQPFTAGGAYVNFMMEEGQERVQATYRDNYDRLASVKKKYDPTNFFRVNQNIRPAA